MIPPHLNPLPRWGEETKWGMDCFVPMASGSAMTGVGEKGVDYRFFTQKRHCMCSALFIYNTKPIIATNRSRKKLHTPLQAFYQLQTDSRISRYTQIIALLVPVTNRAGGLKQD